jgi:hypothetical protein
MAGPPPFGGRQVTLANWQRPPFNRWSFQHVRELIPTARIARGDGPAWELPHGPSQVVVAKLSSWPAALSAPMRRATAAAVTAIASALSRG